MPAASLKAILATGVFGGVALVVMGWLHGGFAAALILMACLSVSDA